MPPTLAYMDGKAIGNRSGIMNSFMGCFGFLPIIGKSKPEGLENHQGKSKSVKSAHYNASSTMTAVAAFMLQKGS